MTNERPQDEAMPEVWARRSTGGVRLQTMVALAKGWEIDQTAITLAQYAVAFGRWEELAPVITAVQYRGQEYDHIGDVASPTV